MNHTIEKMGLIVFLIAIECIVLFLGYTAINLNESANQDNYDVAYELAGMVSNKKFDELKDKEDFLTKMRVLPSIEYPEDKQVCIQSKNNFTHNKTVFFVENHNGIAVIVGVFVSAAMKKEQEKLKKAFAEMDGYEKRSADKNV